MKIIAKIENREGVDKVDEILEVAYGIMMLAVTRIEVPQEDPGIARTYPQGHPSQETGDRCHADAALHD